MKAALFSNPNLDRNEESGPIDGQVRQTLPHDFEDFRDVHLSGERVLKQS